MSTVGAARVGNPVPGDLLLGGWPLLAAAVIAGNDLWLKANHPGLVSGKLSDLAINFLLPLVLVAAWQWSVFAIDAFSGRRCRAPRLPVVWAVAISAGYFAALQLFPAFTDVHVALIRVLGAPLGIATPATNTPDPTDLFTLVTAPLALLYALRQRRRSSRISSASCDTAGFSS